MGWTVDGMGRGQDEQEFNGRDRDGMGMGWGPDGDEIRMRLGPEEDRAGPEKKGSLYDPPMYW